jgi:small membrane protein
MIIRLSLLAALVAIGYWGFLRRSRLPVHILLVLALLGVAALAVVFPSWTTVVANAVGVGRGADLVAYLVEVSLLFVCLHYYTKFVDLQRQVTDLVRELAILRAELELDGRPRFSSGETAPGLSPAPASADGARSGDAGREV